MDIPEVITIHGIKYKVVPDKGYACSQCDLKEQCDEVSNHIDMTYCAKYADFHHHFKKLS